MKSNIEQRKCDNCFKTLQAVGLMAGANTFSGWFELKLETLEGGIFVDLCSPDCVKAFVDNFKKRNSK